MHNFHSKITKKNTPKKTHSEFVNTNLVKISKIQNKIAFLRYFFFDIGLTIAPDAIYFFLKHPTSHKQPKFRHLSLLSTFEYIFQL